MQSITYTAIIIIIIFLLIFSSQQDSFNYLSTDEHYSVLNQNQKKRYIKRCNAYNDKNIIKLTINKHKTNEFLRKKGFPVPKSFFINRNIFKTGYDNGVDMKNVLNTVIDQMSISYPVVMKPTKGTWGLGIVTGITDLDTLYDKITSYILNPKKDDNLIIEEQHAGKVYRILYVNKKILGIIARDIPKVIGDGESSVLDLFQSYKESINKRVRLNRSYVRSQGYEKADIVPKGVIVGLNNILNFDGERQYNVPIETIHPKNKEMFDTIVDKYLGINCVGIDYISDDISVPYNVNNGYILELNSNPDRRIHQKIDDGFMDRYTRELILLSNSSDD